MAGLDKRQRYTFHAEDAADQHDSDERRRPNPERAAPVQPCPEPNEDHDRNVVEPSERVSKPCGEGRCGTMTDMRYGRAGGQHEQRCDWHKSFHELASLSG